MPTMITALTKQTPRKKARPELKFKFSIIGEMRSIAEVLAFDSISQTSMTKAVQIQTVYGLFHGDADNGIMGEAEKFIKGIGPYATMVLWEADTTNDGTIRHVIPELLHQQQGKVLVRGDNITTTLIRRIYESKEDMCKGETIIGHARASICEAKKMSSLMKDAIKERIVTYENDEYDFPSGCNKPQFDQWLLKKMYNWDNLFGPSGGGDPVIEKELDVTADGDDAEIDNGLDAAAAADPDQEAEKKLSVAELMLAAEVMDKEDDRWECDNSSHNALRDKSQLIVEIATSGGEKLNLPYGDSSNGKIAIGKILLEDPTMSAVQCIELAIARFGILVTPRAMDDEELLPSTTAAAAISIFDEAEFEDNQDPPENFLPKGWAVFQMLGPFAPACIRLNFFSDIYLDTSGRKNSRASYRDEQSKAKSARRDLSFDPSDGGSDLSDGDSGSGVSMRGIGAEHKKFIAHQTQIGKQLSNQMFEAEVLRINTVLRSKGGQCDRYLKLHELLTKAGQSEQAALTLVNLTTEMAEIKTLEGQLLDIQNNANAVTNAKGNVD